MAALLVSWQDVLGAVGSWIFVGIAIVLVAGLVAGYVTGSGHSGSNMVGALVIPVVLIALAGEIGKSVAPQQSPDGGTSEA